MGNAQPTNRTGKLATAQKLENAKKLGVLSLTEHNLDSVPRQIFDQELQTKLKTLDLSKNNLQNLPAELRTLVELKSLNLDNNKLPAGSLAHVAKLTKLQTLSASGNLLGQSAIQQKNQSSAPSPEAFPGELPSSLKQLILSANMLSTIPRAVLSPSLNKLEKLDLSGNRLASVDDEIATLVSLVELNLDSNQISRLPDSVGRLRKLKALWLRDNSIAVRSTVFDAITNPQPLPKSLFTDTLLIDLNLHGNKMTNTELNRFEGFAEFLERRQKVKNKTMTNFDVCGLE